MTTPAPPHQWRGLRPIQNHGRVLIVAGCIYVIIGVQFLLVPLTPERRKGLEVALWFSHGSIRFWGVAWLSAGLAAICSSRWPPFTKLWGYAALSWLSAAWFMQFLTALVFLGVSVSIVLGGVCAWGLVTALWLFVAGLVNPDDLRSGGPDD